jgi:hypothetical protein
MGPARRTDRSDVAASQLMYNGQVLLWNGVGRFKATSGLLGFQRPAYQCVVEKGPTPEGAYLVWLVEAGTADGDEYCQLTPSRGRQSIPRGTAAGACEPWWANWGWNRIRFEAADEETRSRCRPSRAGFYLHDSVKGYSHGCIEVEGRFFEVLGSFIEDLRRRRVPLRHLSLSVRYAPGRETSGGTAIGLAP